MKRYRVAIVEPSAIVAEGVGVLLRASADIDVIATYASPAELQRLRSQDVDVVVASLSFVRDIELLRLGGDTPVVGIQSSLADVDTLRRFTAVVSLYSTDSELQQSIRDVVDAPVAEHSHTESHELSERECDVLVLVARGLTNKEIANELNISPHTVMSHRKNIAHKTGIRSVAGLTVYAVLNKLIDSEQL